MSLQVSIASLGRILDALPVSPKDEDLAVLSAALSDRRRELNEAASSMPAYDVRVCQNELSRLTGKMTALKRDQKPSSKFTFKSRTSRESRPATSVEDSRPILPDAGMIFEKHSNCSKPVLEATTGALIIDDSVDNKIDTTTHPDLLDASVVTINNMSGVTIDLCREKHYTSTTFRNLATCVINAHKSSSALFIENCEACELVGEAQQFRIHMSRDCKITYNCRTGRPVIEACSDMHFKNQNDAQETMVDDFDDLSGKRRNWSDMP